MKKNKLLDYVVVERFTEKSRFCITRQFLDKLVAEAKKVKKKPLLKITMNDRKLSYDLEIKISGGKV